MIALDRFKRVNDSLGHAQGDALLRQVGERIASCTGEDDTVARLGGDEFLVICPNTSTDVAADLAHRILSAAEAPASSWGVADSTAARDPDGLLALADAAMYAAKTGVRPAIDTR